MKTAKKHTDIFAGAKMVKDKDPLLEDSDDSNDEDYVLGCEDDLPSEEEDDGEPEEDFLVNGNKSKAACKRKPCQKNNINKRTKVGKRGLCFTALEDDDMNETSQGAMNLTEEDEKKKTDSLWTDFLQDTDFSSSTKQFSKLMNLNSSIKRNFKMESLSEIKKVTITEVFEFAGEEVKVTKEVPADSHAAKNGVCIGQKLTNGFTVGKAFLCKESSKPLNGGGISAVLNQIGKKVKIGTLEKSKLDWDRFKTSQGLKEDILVHNRGRDGFLERQDFLQRADIRQFEIEKQMRKTTRSSR